MKIAICEFRQETDSFNPVLCKRINFERGGIHAGHDITDKLSGKPCAVGGMLKACEEAGAHVYPLYSMNANSGGVVDDAVVNEFIDETIQRLNAVLPVDILLVSLHGATHAVSHEDACGYILSTLRELVGKDTVIAASYDLHANITDLMQKSADYFAGYNTYPHVDFYETGYRAASMALRAFNSGKSQRPVLVRAKLPLLAAPSTFTTLRGPFGELMKEAKALVAKGELIDVSIFNVQPWMDVRELGSCVVTVAADRESAQKHCASLARKFFDIRHSFKPELYSIDEIIDIANVNPTGKPVVMGDASDSPNAGACGDCPALIERILATGSNVRTAMFMNDPEAIERIYAAGVNADITLPIGASMCDEFYKPVTVNAHVRSLNDGRFTPAGADGRGVVQTLGRTAVLEIGNIDLLVCEQISRPGDLNLYRHFGIEPTAYQLVSVKACTSFRANYEPLAAKICEADTPGVAPSRLERMRFKRFSTKGVYPFEEIDESSITDPA